MQHKTNDMKLTTKIVLVCFGLIALLIVLLVGVMHRNNTLQSKYETAMGNIKSYDQLLSTASNKNTAYQLTIDQFNSFQDSIIRQLHDTKEELRIKDKNLKALQYVASSFTKADTIIIGDTIFKDTDFHLDTLIGDAWYNVQVGLSYPATVSVKPKFKSIKHVIISTRKETVNPPKSFFLFRLFQKKHKVIQVDVIEQNPYIEDDFSRYVEVVK